MKILITGNGFDLFHSLPTKYIDFLRIARHISENNNFDLHSIYNALDRRTYESIFEHYNEFELDTASIQQLKDILQTNMWFNYLKNEFNRDATWIDLELELARALNKLDFEINKIKKEVFKNHSNREYSSLNYDYDEIIIDFEIYQLQNEEFPINDSLLTKDRYGYPKAINQEAIKEHLYNDFENLKNAFNLYLHTFVEPLLNNVKRVILPQTIFSNIQYHYTFNYTTTAKKLYQSNTQYVHGQTNSGLSNIVIGIDEKKNSNTTWLKFTKHHQKIHLDTNYRFFSDLKNNFGFHNIHFYIIGHSLNESDKYYIDEIFNFLKENNGNKLCIFYHSLQSKASILEKLMIYKNSTDIMKIHESGNIYFKPLTEESIVEEIDHEYNFLNI